MMLHKGDEADANPLSASGKFRLRAGSLSRTLLGRSPDGSKVNLHEHRDDTSLARASPSNASVDSIPNSSGVTLPDRMRRLSSSTSSANSSDSRSLTQRRGSPNPLAQPSSLSSSHPAPTRSPPAAPSHSHRRHPRGSWNREPATNDEHVAQRLRALPRLSSYSSASQAPPVFSPSSIPPVPSSPQPEMPAAQPSTDASDSALSSTEHESDDDMHDTDHHEDLESDADHQSSPETEDNSPFFTHTQSSTPNTSPDSVVPHPDPELSDATQDPALKSWTAFSSAATPMTARPAVVDANATSYFDSRPLSASRSNDPSSSPKDTLRTPTASRPNSSSQRRSFAPRPIPADPGFPLLSPRFEAGEMLEREAKELREKLKTTQQFQLQPPPPSAEARRTPPPKRTSADSVASSSDAESLQSKEGLPSYDPGPLGARLPYSAVHPRDDEGAEQLPGYSCAVHIEGWMPRKCEFIKAGVQATNRTWKRQYIVLHGTSLRVLNGDPNEKHGRRVAPTAVRTGHPEPVQSYRPPTTDVASSRRRQSDSTSGARQDCPEASKLADDPEADDPLQEGSVTLKAAKRSNSGSRDMYVHEGHYDGAKSSLSKTIATKVLQKDNPDVLRHYTLQGAESGLAADYTKRNHCIRIRAEGEQFLIQAADDRGVIDWIEALQAATNVALDLDNRPLPKFITLPRRRRRRRVMDQNGRDVNGQRQSENAAAAATGGATGAMGAEIAEEQRRDVSAF